MGLEMLNPKLKINSVIRVINDSVELTSEQSQVRIVNLTLSPEMFCK